MVVWQERVVKMSDAVAGVLKNWDQTYGSGTIPYGAAAEPVLEELEGKGLIKLSSSGGYVITVEGHCIASMI